MDPTTLAETVRNAVFHSTQFRDGYDEGAVDGLLDELVRALENGSSASEVAAIVSSAKLPTTSMRRGYDRGEVGAFLDEVVRQASGLVTTAPPRMPAPVPHESSGLGARLLRVLRGD